MACLGRNVRALSFYDNHFMAISEFVVQKVLSDVASQQDYGNEVHMKRMRIPLGFIRNIKVFPLGFIRNIKVFPLGFVRKGNNFLCVSEITSLSWLSHQ